MSGALSLAQSWIKSKWKKKFLLVSYISLLKCYALNANDLICWLDDVLTFVPSVCCRTHQWRSFSGRRWSGRWPCTPQSHTATTEAYSIPGGSWLWHETEIKAEEMHDFTYGRVLTMYMHVWHCSCLTFPCILSRWRSDFSNFCPKSQLKSLFYNCLLLTASISASRRVLYCMLLVVSTWSSWPLMVGE